MSMKQIAVMFSGQGSQYLGMGKKLFERDGATRAMFDRASRLLDLDMAQLCFSGPAEELNRTENTQPALLLCSVADYRHFRARTDVTPAFMAGHSLGELSALVAADAMSLDDGLLLARARGLAMSRCATEVKTGMHAVTRLERAVVEQICADTPGFGADFVLANVNAPGQFVLSGSVAAMEAAGAALKQAGGAIIPLKVSGPFHSPYMAAAAEQFGAALARVEWRSARVPVLSSMDGRAHGAGQQIARALMEQMTGPVLWSDTMQVLQRAGIDAYLEAGPGAVLKKLALNNLPGASAYGLDVDDDAPAIEKLFAAELRAVEQRPSVVGRCMAVAVCTQNNNWNEDDYQQGVIDPYRQLQALQEGLEQAGAQPNAEQMRQALDCLGRIFATKGTPADERAWRLSQIIESTGSAEVLADYAFRQAA
jgi:[acyl-carrier-protein] S-malonyltransferase